MGVLLACLLLVSSVASEGVFNSTVELPTEYVEVVGEQQLMHLPFGERLRNTCDLLKDNMSSISTGGRGVRFDVEFLSDILVYVNLTKSNVLEVLQNNTISDCANLHIDNLPETPTLEELQEMDLNAALNKAYASLLVHSGRSYFISHQINSSETSCSDDIEGDQTLADLARELAEKQRFLACRLKFGMKLLGYTLEDASLEDERFSDLPQCSLRSLRDCQVMKSAKNFLQAFMDYVSDYTKVYSTTWQDNLSTVFRVTL